MSKSWPKIIRDPVHNLVLFQDTPGDRLLLDLINTREFQRLRRVKQLGMSELVFPGANHSRFAHSIGVMQTARLFFDRLNILMDKKLEQEHQTIVLVAALLHDLGHGPFSHAFEKITGESHEARTLEIIKDTSTEVNAKLKAYNAALPERLGRFFDEDWQADGKDTFPSYLVGVVSSRLDADRFDYLLRDSYATGTDYGEFDLQWLIQHLFPDETKGRFYLSHKALSTAEAYVFARHHMYQSVYFHKTTRAAEVMLRLLFKRYKALLEQAPAGQRTTIVPDAPRSIVGAFSGKIGLGDYLKLDDHTITEFVKACEFSGDLVLKVLGSGLLNRILFKAVDATDANGAQVANFHAAALELIKSKGQEPDCVFSDDTPADTPYKAYDPDEEEPETMIWVENLAGKPVELSSISESVLVLRKKLTLVRYYFPVSVRDEMKKLAKDHLGKVTP